MKSPGSLIRELEAATHDVGVRRHAALADLRLDQAQMHVLSLLAASGPLTVKQIHASFGHRPSTVTDILDRLERRDLVVRSTNPDDRRSYIVALTPAGKRAAERVLAVTEQIETDLAARIGSARADALLEGLGALRQVTAERRG